MSAWITLHMKSIKCRVGVHKESLGWVWLGKHFNTAFWHRMTSVPHYTFFSCLQTLLWISCKALKWLHLNRAVSVALSVRLFSVFLLCGKTDIGYTRGFYIYFKAANRFPLWFFGWSPGIGWTRDADARGTRANDSFSYTEPNEHRLYLSWKLTPTHHLFLFFFSEQDEQHHISYI